MRRLNVIAALATILLGGLTSSDAQQLVSRVQVGVLECRGGASIGFIVGSVTNLGCVLRVEGVPEDRYIATIQKVGLDLGVTAQTQVRWAVNAPTSRLGFGELAGTYGGVGANASIGIGGGGNFLVGGPRNAYALQPISVQGQTGLNVAAGIAGLDLKPADVGVRHWHHRFHHHHHRHG